MLDTARGKVAAMTAMAACCSLSMAVALGVVAVTSTALLAGAAIAVAVGCLVFMVVIGHHGHHRDGAETSG